MITRCITRSDARARRYHPGRALAEAGRMLGGFTGDAAAALRIGVALQILRMYEISGDTLQALQ